MAARPRKEIVKAALPIADCHNPVGALQYVEGRVLGGKRHTHAQMLSVWRKTLLHALRSGSISSLASMLFRWAKLVERIRDGILPYIVVTG